MNSKKFLVLLILLLLASQGVFSAMRRVQPIRANSEVPLWLKKHMEFMTRGSGRWVADNSKFKNENEPFDSYVTEWVWGPGKKTMKGRLYGVSEGKKSEIFWEYLVFWHPKEEIAVFQQFGLSGAYGVGEMSNIGESKDGRIGRRTDLVFYGPDASTWKDRHELFESAGVHETTSFDFAKGDWVKGRNYVWKFGG